jgi:uncharacterized membrane protein (UPF0127 family)
MRVVRLFFLLLTMAGFTGCNSSTPSATPPPTADLAPLVEPTHAQAKLSTIKLFIGAETLATEQALTEEQEMTGMMYRTNIQDTDAMIFVLPVPQRASFWMKNCPESISAAYLTADGVIQEIHHLEKNDTNPVVSVQDNIQYVLETSDGWFDRHHVATGMAITTERGTLAQTYFH